MSDAQCTDEKLGSLIAAYELGALDQAQREAFVEHAFDCPYCNEELYGMEPYMNVLRAEVPRLRKQPVAMVTATRGQPWRRLGALAAALVLSGLGGYLYYITSRDTRDATPLSQISVTKAGYVPSTENVRAGTGGAFKAAMGAYQRNDFQSAARELEALIRLEPENTEARFYRGVSLLLLEEDNEAISVLTDAADRAAATPLGEGCRYYLALACARSGRVEEARAEAQAVVDMNGRYRASAEDLLKVLVSPDRSTAQ